MHILDFIVFGLYMAGVLAVGYYYFRQNKNTDDYYVAGRTMGATHIGLSIVATDVGGGFSIGLGGLGFAMGLAGSWLLFTGLIGAWFSAVFLIPKIKKLDAMEKMLTFPDFLRHRYNDRVALLAALISGLGYMGFTGGQILAGAKLSSATLITEAPWGLTPLQFSLLIIAIITVAYTSIGGMKAVIYTDTIQWIILLTGLVVITIPVAIWRVGGWTIIREELPRSFFSLWSVDVTTVINWMVTIIPIWLVGMTLYQRMYACRDEKEARRAWFLAGLFEYPVMAFSGVFLGMCARAALGSSLDAEMGLPLLIKNFLPIGVTGIIIAAYFSAIMSTADSCMMASSGNLVNDVIDRYLLRGKEVSHRVSMLISQGVTLVIGVVAVVLASQFQMVLDAVMHAYGFMVAGLFVPTLGAYFWRRSSATAAFWAMIVGGSVALMLQLGVKLPQPFAGLGLNPSFYGILCSVVIFVPFSYLFPNPYADKAEDNILATKDS